MKSDYFMILWNEPLVFIVSSSLWFSFHFLPLKPEQRVLVLSSGFRFALSRCFSVTQLCVVSLFCRWQTVTNSLELASRVQPGRGRHNVSLLGLDPSLSRRNVCHIITGWADFNAKQTRRNGWEIYFSASNRSYEFKKTLAQAVLIYFSFNTGVSNSFLFWATRMSFRGRKCW